MEARIIPEVWNQSLESKSGSSRQWKWESKSIFKHVEYIHRRESYIQNGEQSIKSGILEVRGRNTGMWCYMNGGHRKAELDRNKRRVLDYKQEIGLEVESFCDPEDAQASLGCIQVRAWSISSGNLRMQLKMTVWPRTSRKFVSEVTRVLWDVTDDNHLDINCFTHHGSQEDGNLVVRWDVDIWCEVRKQAYVKHCYLQSCVSGDQAFIT